MFILRNWHSPIKSGVTAVLLLIISLTSCHSISSDSSSTSASRVPVGIPQLPGQPLSSNANPGPETGVDKTPTSKGTSESSSQQPGKSETGVNENYTPEVTPGSSFQQPGKILIDISTQKLSLFSAEGGTLIKEYYISTSKYGIGSQAGSNKTPLGVHRIEQKIGDGAPLNTIFKARVSTNRQAKINQEQGDLVTTRILWLKGLEAGKNEGPGVDSYQRFIYIHGTAAEKDIGKPASHGCIRMYNQDVIDLFEQVPEKLKVEIDCTIKNGAGECDYAPEIKEKMKMSS